MDSTRLHSQLVKRLESSGISEHGSQFIAGALSPAEGSAVKMPDERTCPTVVQRFVQQETYTTPVPDASWDCLVLKPPSDAIAAIVVRKPSSTDTPFNLMPSGGTSVDILFNTGYTAFPSASAVVAGTVPSWASTVVLSNELLFSQWRLGASSLTVTNTSSSLVDGGTVYAGQYQRELPYHMGTFYNDAIGGPGADSILTSPTWGVDIPMSGSEMSKLATRELYMAKAKEGVYIPCLPSGDDHPFVVAPSANFGLARNYAGGGTWGADMICVNQKVADSQSVLGTLRFIGGPDTTNGYVPWSYGNQATVDWGFPNTFLTSSLDTSVSWGVALFEGLPAEATLSVKGVTSIEYVPLSMSPGRSFLTPAPKYDAKAMAMLSELASQQAHAYPARDNFLGMLLPLIGRAAMAIARPIAGFLGHTGVKAAATEALTAGAKSAAAAATTGASAAS
jgi:hypothetical protein